MYNTYDRYYCIDIELQKYKNIVNWPPYKNSPGLRNKHHQDIRPRGHSEITSYVTVVKTANDIMIHGSNKALSNF